MVAPVQAAEVPARDETTAPPEAAAARVAPPTPVQPAPPPPPEIAVWPRSAQWAAAALLVASAALIAWRWYGDHRGTRPGELVRARALPQPIDLNRAGRAELLQLPGIGPQLADHILSYREAHGPFGRVDDLRGVHGIGDGTLGRLRPWLRVDAPDGDEPPDPDEKPVRLTRKPQAAIATTPIDLNHATLDDLEKLPGIGPVLAKRIVAERQKQPFAKVDDLRRVSGIGPKTLEKLRPHVTIGS